MRFVPESDIPVAVDGTQNSDHLNNTIELPDFNSAELLVDTNELIDYVEEGISGQHLIFLSVHNSINSIFFRRSRGFE